jgi:hypothetical protein
MKILSLFLGLTIITPQLVYGARHCKTERSQSVAEQLAKLEPKADLDLIDLEIFPKGNVVAGYEYEVDSAYTKGLYSRSDSWQITADAKPEREISKGFDLKLSGGIESQTIAKFTRFFKDPCLAMKATPYSPKRMPFTKEVALGPKFQIGDYFLFRGSVGIIASAEILKMIGGLWGTSLSASYLMQGFYQLHIVRIDDKHIRLKVMAHRGTVKSGSIGVGYEDEFDIFAINALNNAVERFVNTKPIRVGANQKKSRVFMMDYVLDLTDPEVSEAFEDILPKAKDIKQIGFIEAFKQLSNLESSILLDLSGLEKLYRRDYEAGNVKRILRNLKTSSNQNMIDLGIQLGNKLLGFKYENRKATGLMANRNDDDTLQKYLLSSWERVTEGRFLISIFRSVHEEFFRALFTADEKYVSLTPVTIVKHINLKKSAITYRGFQEIKSRMRKLLPEEIYNKVPWSNWTQTDRQKFENFGMRFEMAISPELIQSLPQLKAPEIQKLFLEYMKRKNLTATDFIQNPNSEFQDNDDLFQDHFKRMSRTLEKALDQTKRSKERVSYISDLRSNPVFEDTGLGFLVSLKPEMMDRSMHLDLDISSNNALIEFEYGSSELTTVYKKILTIKAALDDDALDPLREAESLSLPKED